MRKPKSMGLLVTMIFLLISLFIPMAYGQQPIRVLVQGRQADLAEHVERFLADHLPGLDVQVTTEASLTPLTLQDKLVGHDVVAAPNLSFSIPSGILLPLDWYVQRTGFDHPLLDSMRVEGSLYDLPIFLDMYTVTYNRDIFDQHGLPYPHSRWTWDDFVEAVIRTSNPYVDPPIYGATLPVASLFHSIPYQAHSSLLDATDETLRYTLSIGSALLQGEALIFDSFGTSPHFRNGEAAMQVTPLSLALLQQGVFALHENNVDWGIAPLPSVPGLTGMNRIENSVFTVGIAADTPHPDRAWDVARLLATEGALVVGTPVDLPAFLTSDLQVQIWLSRVLRPDQQATREEFLQLLQRRQMFMERPGSYMIGPLREQFNLMLDGVVSQEEALDALRTRRDELRAEAGL